MENEDFLNRLFAVVTNQINQAAADFREDIVRIKAEQSVHRFLLEILYTNAFKDEIETLEEIALASIQAKPVKLEPMTEEQVNEGLMLINLSLERFFESVRQRIQNSGG